MELDPQVLALAKAIRQAESGGNYTARSKDGSFGAYQFIKPTWDRTAKKYGVTAEWEKATPAEQNKVVYMQLKEWKDKGYVPNQIASMWNAGEGRPNAYKTGLSGTNKDGVNYNVAKYAEKVARYYQQYKGGGTTPAPQVPTIQAQRAELQAQGQPLPVNKEKVNTTRGGDILRGIIKPFVRGVNTVVQPLQAAVTGKKLSDVDTYNEYLGDVSGFGMRDNQTGGQRVKDVAGGAAEIASTFVGGGGAVQLGKATLKGAVKQGAVQGLKAGAKSGALQQFGATLQNDGGLKETVTNTAIGAGTGGVFGGVIGGGAPLLSKVVSTAKNLINPSEKAIAEAVDELEGKYVELFTGTKPLKNKFDKAQNTTNIKNQAGTQGKPPQRVLAENGIIPKQQGTKLDTLQQADEFRETITPLYEANRAALREAQLSTPPVSVDDVEDIAIQKILNSKLTSSQKQQMIAKARAEFDATRAEFGETIKLTDLDFIKSTHWGATKFDTAIPQLERDVQYNIAKAYQKTIEETAAKAGLDDVAQLNREIGDRLEAAKFLESLNGNTVKGGKLGIYFGRIIGMGLGSQSPVPGGAILGAIGGDTITKMLINNSVSNPVKRLLLKNLQRKDPVAYTNIVKWLESQGKMRELRELLPAPKPLGSEGNPIITPSPTTYEAPAKIIKDSTRYPIQLLLPSGNRNIKPGITIRLPEKSQSTIDKLEGLNPNIKRDLYTRIVNISKLPKEKRGSALKETLEKYLSDDELPVIDFGKKPKPKGIPNLPIIR